MERSWDWERIDIEMEKAYKAHADTYQFLWVRELLRDVCSDMQATIDAQAAQLATLKAQVQEAGPWEDVEYNDIINVDNSNQIRVVIDQGGKDKRVHLHIRKRALGEWSHVGVTTLSEGYRIQKRKPQEGDA